MLKYSLYLIVAAIFIAGIISTFHLTKVYLRNKNEMARYISIDEVYDNNLGKTIVIYYSLTGRTENIAEQIAEITGADIYRIKTVEELKTGISFYSTIKKQLKTKKYPELIEDFPNLKDYNTIFVGSPIWWYTAATPVLSFLEKINFDGKKVISFSTQGSNYGTFFDDFRAQARDANVIDGASFNNMSSEYNKAVKNKIIVWLNSIQ